MRIPHAAQIRRASKTEKIACHAPTYAEDQRAALHPGIEQRIEHSLDRSKTFSPFPKSKRENRVPAQGRAGILSDANNMAVSVAEYDRGSVASARKGLQFRAHSSGYDDRITEIVVDDRFGHYRPSWIG